MKDAEKKLATPTVCARIKALRMERKDRWAADNPKEKGNPFTQETMAQRIGVTRDAYRDWETVTEPSLKRLRQIAVALELAEDYFEPTGSLAEATANLEAETERVKALADDLAEIVPALREALQSLPPNEESAPTQGEQE